MTPKSFFIVLIKIVGLYVAAKSILLFPQLIYSLFLYSYPGDEELLSIGGKIAVVLLALIVVYYILYFLFFRTEWLVNKLSLDKNFSEEKFEFSMHRSSVLRIAVIVIGGLLFIEALPYFFRYVYLFLGDKQTTGRFGGNPSTGWMILEAVKLIMGFFFMTSSRLVVNYVEKERRKR